MTRLSIGQRADRLPEESLNAQRLLPRRRTGRRRRRRFKKILRITFNLLLLGLAVYAIMLFPLETGIILLLLLLLLIKIT